MAITHPFVSGIADEADATLVQPSDWNDAHTIDAGTITLAMQASIATASFLGRNTASTGVIEVLSVSTAKTLLNLTGTNSGDQTITLTGDVTGSGTGSFAATIAAQAVGVAKMTATQTDVFFGRDTAGAGAGEEISAASAKTILSLNLVENTALSTWAGSTAITTLGTIVTGVWNGTAIANANLANSSVTFNGTAVALGASGTLTLASANFANQGTTTTVLHGNAAGNPSFGAVVLTSDVSGILPTANGGTGIAYFTAAGPTVARVYTFPDAAATILYSGGALGTPSSGTLTSCTGLPEAGLTLADNTTGNFTTLLHGFVPKGTNVGNFLKDDGTWAAASGGATLDGITAATGDQTGILSGDNYVKWKWAKTTNSEQAFELTESAAATNGTSTSGIPNQVLLKLSTLAASTMSPLQVYSRAAHVFSVSPSTAQMLFADGTASAPVLARAGDTLFGFYFSGNSINMGRNGSQWLHFEQNYISANDGTTTEPSINSLSYTGSGFFWPDANSVGIINNSREVVRFTGYGGGGGVSPYAQFVQGMANSTAYAINIRKARGTPSVPTVITTGDDLAVIGAFGYVGATGYVEACRLTMDSTGTIANTATGVGGIFRFSQMIVGTAIAEVLMIKDHHVVHEGTSPTITAGGGTNPSILGKDEAFEVTIGTGGVATSVEVTFGHAFTTNAPICVVMSDTDIVPFKCVTTTTKVTITATLAFTAGSILHCVVRGWE